MVPGARTLLFLLLCLGAPESFAATLTLERGGEGTGTVGTLPDGVFCGEGCAASSAGFPAGTSLVIVARPSPGSDFDGWEGDCAGTAAACEVTLGEDLRARARFRPSLDLPSCGSDTVFWSHSPLDIALLTAVVPLGNLNPQGGHVFPTRHIYLQSSAASVPVYAPGRAVITGMRAELRTDPVTGWSGWDYEIDLSPCREHRTILLHLQEIPKSILSLVGAPDWCDPAGEICLWSNRRAEVTPGLEIGKTGLVGSATLDLESYDMRAPATSTYANPERGLPEWRELICPLDAFTDVPATAPNERFLRGTLFGLLGSFDGARRRTAPPLCGSAAQDLPGKAQGNWYLDGWPRGFSEDAHLALVHDAVDPTIPVFSLRLALDGTSPGVPSLPPDQRLPAGQYAYTVYPFATPVNLDFPALDASEQRIYCFEKAMHAPQGPLLDETVLLLQMTSATELRLKKVKAWGCWALSAVEWDPNPFPAPLAGAVRFVR